MKRSAVPTSKANLKLVKEIILRRINIINGWCLLRRLIYDVSIS